MVLDASQQYPNRRKVQNLAFNGTLVSLATVMELQRTVKVGEQLASELYKA
jgi:hypothetical protein